MTASLDDQDEAANDELYAMDLCVTCVQCSSPNWPECEQRYMGTCPFDRGNL